MNVSKDITNIIVILVLMASMFTGLYYVSLVKQKIDFNTSLIVAENKKTLNQIIQNQKVIIGNITEHRQEVNNTLFHLDDEIDEILKLMGSNVTFGDEFKSSRESGHISELSP